METTVSLLIVDDSPANLAVIEDTLDEFVDNIYTSGAPQDVLDLCVDKAINIALIDVKMPLISGIDLLRQIKANPLTNHIVVVLMTGFSFASQDIISGLEAGAIDYLFKPLDLYVTRAKMQSIIELVKYQNQIRLKNMELEVYQSKLQKAMELSERNKVNKDKFFSNMSHEIRTPLNAIVGIIGLLKDNPAPSGQHELMGLLEESTNSVLGLINDILDSAKIEEGKVKIFNENNDIKKCFISACRLLEQAAVKKGIRYNITVDEDIPAIVRFDVLRLNQILMNLLGNAIKFTNSGGVDARLRLRDQTGNNILLELEVADSGIGISESALKKVFNRFEQAEDDTCEKFGGTGLGLSIVKSLSELMGGKISVKSTLGVGTTFTFACWFALGEAAEADIERATEALSPLNVSVLLAEDNRINQLVTRRIMEKWNIRVDIAEDGLVVLEKMKDNEYDLILMDSNMPGLGGYEVTRIIRNSDNFYKDIPIISFSATVSEADKEKGFENGFNDFVSKPFVTNDLYHKIKNHIRRSKSHLNQQQDFIVQPMAS